MMTHVMIPWWMKQARMLLAWLLFGVFLWWALIGSAWALDCDVDGNGFCTAGDYVSCRRQVLGHAEPNPRVDLDRSGAVTARDCLLLRHSVLGYRNLYYADGIDDLAVGTQDIPLLGEGLRHAEAFLDGEPLHSSRIVDLPCTEAALDHESYWVTTMYTLNGIQLPGDAIELRVDTSRIAPECAERLSLADAGIPESDAGPSDLDAGLPEIDPDAGAIEPECGNGVLELSEQCDDGNRVDGDGCSANCVSEEDADLLGCNVGEHEGNPDYRGNPFGPCDDDLAFRDGHNNDELLAVRIFVHVARNADGVDAIDAQALSEMAAEATRYYLPARIVLDWVNLEDPHVIQDNDYFNPTGNLYQDLIQIDNAPDAVDIYIVNTLTAHGRSLCGIAADIGYDPREGDGSVTRAVCGGDTLAHEIGHTLGLWHTHQSFKLDEEDCNSEGDLCCDTPPDPRRGTSDSSRSYCNNPSLPVCAPANCFNADGNPLDISPDIFNLMSYYRCRNHTEESHLTDDQVARARCYVVNQYAYALGECDPGDPHDHLSCVEDELYWHDACNRPTDFVRRCLDGCGDGACSPPPGCNGPTERPCGRCGTTRRVCIDDRDWSAWGPCTDEGPCMPGEIEMCLNQGRRTCTNLCEWSPCDVCFGRVEGEVITPGSWSECGGFTDRCGQTGTQTRPVDVCRSGELVTETEERPCHRDTDGVVVERGQWSECAEFDDECDEEGIEQRQNTVCREGLPVEERETQICQRDTGNFDVFVGDWSICQYSDGACDETGTRTRAHIICIDGHAEDQPDVEACTRETDGNIIDPGTWSSCTGYTDNCDETGQRERARRICRNGTETSERETDACGRNTDGNVIDAGSWSACGNFSSTCDESGRRERERRICRNGSIRQEPETANCSRDTDGQIARTDDWSACNYSNQCDEQAERTQNVWICRTGSERLETRREPCRRNTDGDLVSRGSWSSCSGFSSTCDETGERRRTDRMCQNGRSVDQVAIDTCRRNTDGDRCTRNGNAGLCGDSTCRPTYEIDGCTGGNYVSACARECEGCRSENGFIGYNQSGCNNMTCFNRFPNHGHNGFVLMYTRSNSQTAYTRWQFPATLRGRYRIRADIPSTNNLHEPVCRRWSVSTAATYNLKRGNATQSSRQVDQSSNRGRLVTIFEGDLTGTDAVTLGNRWLGFNGCGQILADRLVVEPI